MPPSWPRASMSSDRTGGPGWRRLQTPAAGWQAYAIPWRHSGDRPTELQTLTALTSSRASRRTGLTRPASFAALGRMSRPVLDFFLEFASTYSYPAAMRIGALAEAAGVAVRWRPFLLGPIFRAQGWDNSPFNLYPAKGRYMWRDLTRTCESLGLPFRRPDPFPQPSVLAARLAHVGLEGGWGEDFCRAVYAAEFGAGRPIGEE